MLQTLTTTQGGKRPVYGDLMSTDHFSGHAGEYAKYRPNYPPELFAWLALHSPGNDLAWDCGTGNGQAALALASHYVAVHATDLSPQQLAAAPTDPRVHYLATPAESSGLPEISCDLVTVAQALHWFCHEAFYTEVKRVLRQGGLIAAWTYRLIESEPDLNAAVAHFHSKVVGPWWPKERKWVDVGYQGIPFPFADIPIPPFCIHREWTLAELLSYLRTWSATQRCWQETGIDPTLQFGVSLASIWPEPEQTRSISWPLAIRCGRMI